MDQTQPILNPEAPRARPESDTPPTPPPGVHAGMFDESSGYYWQQCSRCQTWWNDLDEDETIGACPVCKPKMLAEYVQQPAWAWRAGQWSLDDRINQRAADAWALSPHHLSVREQRRHCDPAEHLRKVHERCAFLPPQRKSQGAAAHAA